MGRNKSLFESRTSASAAGVQRREFLRSLLLSPALMPLPQSALLWRAAALLQAPATKDSARELVTANADFFVRNHFPAPQISSDTWHLEITGLVSKPINLSYSDLLLMNPARLHCTLECAGNLSGGKGVGNAVWSGASLATLLKQAGVKPQAAYVVLHGADSGSGEDLPPGTHFARAIPLEKALSDSTLLAYEMNGSPLPAEHGFPLRAVVAGWYGMDSVKWLSRIEVTEQPFQGYFQQRHYVATNRDGNIRPITRMLVSSKFLRPSQDEEIRERVYHVEGVAWAGEAKISKVEFRASPGEAWQNAVLDASPTPYVWTRWSCDWHVPGPGKYTLEVRATDSDGNTQPAMHDSARRDAYELNTPHRVPVVAR
ncbi:MAG TPA: sulfite oxidase [Terriglobales bacterium]|nr:sulfite oxidase [Terriglobales bacterium]